MEKKVVIIDYGAGNTRSVSFAFERLGIRPILSSDQEVIAAATHVVFPGVGHASSAMKALKEKDLADFIPSLKQPVLGICLGMQLMCRFTEEGQTEGIGIFDVDVLRFSEELKVPHMGWNNITGGKSMLQDIENQLYFIHSYYAPECEETIALCDYHGRFSAALMKNNFIACQFHPEKSGGVGAETLKRFLNL